MDWADEVGQSHVGCLLVAVAVTFVITLVSVHGSQVSQKETENWNHWLGFISGGLIGLMILAGVGIFSALAQHQRDNTPQSLFGASGNGSQIREGRWIKNNGELIEQSTIGSAFVGPQPLLTVRSGESSKIVAPSPRFSSALRN